MPRSSLILAALVSYAGLMGGVTAADRSQTLIAKVRAVNRCERPAVPFTPRPMAFIGAASVPNCVPLYDETPEASDANDPQSTDRQIAARQVDALN